MLTVSNLKMSTLWILLHCLCSIDDPNKGPIEENLKIKNSGEKCQHQYGQIENSPDTECRIGNYLLTNGKKILKHYKL